MTKDVVLARKAELEQMLANQRAARTQTADLLDMMDAKIHGFMGAIETCDFLVAQIEAEEKKPKDVVPTSSAADAASVGPKLAE